MGIENHKREFDRIIKRYSLSDDDKAEKISNYLTKHPDGKVSAKEFANIFGMTEKEAVSFLSFIHRGIQFKEQHIDKK